MKGSVTRVLALVAAAAVVMCGLLSQAVMSAPTAQALTEDEQIYISLLVSEGIGPTANSSYEELVFIGHAIAWDLRNGVRPADEAYTLWSKNPGLTRDQAITVVATAMAVFAPELLPIYAGEPVSPANTVA